MRDDLDGQILNENNSVMPSAPDPAMWNGCDLGKLRSEDSQGNLEPDCPAFMIPRILFFSSFLLLSMFLTFSFTRHHVKYKINPLQGIITERHRVVLPLAIGTFARALSFVVAGEFWNIAGSHIGHVVLTIIKDICYVVCFTVVVAFWLYCLHLFNLNDAATYTMSKKIQIGVVAVFAMLRILSAILREVRSDTLIPSITYGVLVVFYFLLFVAALLYGCRLRSKLQRVGPLVSKNLRRLTAFMIAEIFFLAVLFFGTLTRQAVFHGEIGFLTPSTHPAEYIFFRTLVKCAELACIATLTLMMIARAKVESYTEGDTTSDSVRDSAGMKMRSDGFSSFSKPSNLRSSGVLLHKRDASQNPTMLFDRVSFLTASSSLVDASLEEPGSIRSLGEAVEGKKGAKDAQEKEKATDVDAGINTIEEEVQ